MVTAIDKSAHIPRLTSGISLVGIAAVVIGLIGAGLVLSPIVVGIIGLIWLFIFFFRHQPPVDRPLGPVNPEDTPQ
jgi:hypothetical protein